MASNGFTSARSDCGDRTLHTVGVHVSANQRRDILELQIRDEYAPHERCWISVIIDRQTGAVVSGTGRDGDAAWTQARKALV